MAAYIIYMYHYQNPSLTIPSDRYSFIGDILRFIFSYICSLLKRSAPADNLLLKILNNTNELEKTLSHGYQVISQLPPCVDHP